MAKPVDFTIGDKKYSYKGLLRDITLKEFVGYCEIKKPQSVIDEKKIEELTSEELIERAEWSAKVVSYWTGVPVDVLKKTNVEDVYNLLNVILGVFTQEVESVDRFTIKGQEFLFPKSLLMGTTFGEFADASVIEKESGLLEQGNYQSAAKIMAIYCRKAGEEYVGELIEERSKLFLELPLPVVFAFCAFFFELKVISIQNTAIYSLQMQLRDKKRLELLN